MNNLEKIKKLTQILEEIKDQLDTECCQTLMDADSISVKIEKILRELSD